MFYVVIRSKFGGEKPANALANPEAALAQEDGHE
jgi:hypothetical protein